MTKLEAVIQPTKLDAVKEALINIGVDGLTVLEARGHGRQKGHTEFYRGREYSIDLLPKIKLEIVLRDEMVDEVVKTIITAAQTGKIGDGKIFLSRIDEAIRIRNEERGADAIVLATEWEEFKNVDYGRIKPLMTHPMLFDGRNLLDPEAMKALGFTYLSVGR